MSVLVKKYVKMVVMLYELYCNQMILRIKITYI